MFVHGRQVADHVLHTMGVIDQQDRAGQAADIFLALEHELCSAAMGLDRPGAGGDEAAHILQLQNFG